MTVSAALTVLAVMTVLAVSAVMANLNSVLTKWGFLGIHGFL